MTRLDDFTANVAKSGLVAPDVLAHILSQVDPSPVDDAAVRLARQLVGGGWLTTYQARKLLAGATRGFFLGGYRLLRQLGEGGMGKVYLAVGDDQQNVAIKVLPPRKALTEENALRRFHREMDLSQRCSHPNLARTLAVGSEGDVHFMVMEYISGESLYQLVKSQSEGPLRVPDAARLFLKLLEGLGAAHAAGLIHRDIKPSNIMITPEGDVKLLDMGLARALGDETGLTHANTVLGTLDYASPEQLRDAAKADVRSDLYSVGCTLYYALAGQPPFEGGDMINKIYRQRLEDPLPLEKVARGVPTAFAAVVRKLMSKEPGERHLNCEDLHDDLMRWTDPELVHAMVGQEAEAARSFRPPPPELVEEDLRVLDRDSSFSGSDALSLRDLGGAEPSHAPRYQPPKPPLPALVRSPPKRETLPRRPQVGDAPMSDSRWLIQFAIVAAIIGVVAILCIAIFLKS